MNQVLVTGLGMLTPLGANKTDSFAAALAAHSAIRALPEDRCAGLTHILQAPAAVEPGPLLDRAQAGLDRAAQFALLATQEALTEAELEAAPWPDASRVGIYVGIGFGGAETVDGLYTRYFQALHGGKGRQATVMHPLSVPRMMANATAAAISMRHGIRGATYTYSVACASSAVAAGEALRAIRHGYLDAAIVVGTEAMLTPGSIVAWNALRVMARPDDTDPAASCKPFAADRTGFVLGEGAAALVLESTAHAARRGRPALAELAGYGCSSDAHHLTAPSVEGQVTAMTQALREAGLAPEQVQYLNAHGTATDAGDVIETQSIQAVFGAAADQLAVSSTKAVHGHLIGAGGTVELGLSLMALQSGSIPPTAHLHQPDPRCPLDYVPLQARHGCDIQAVMSNSFAFGGTNACLVARRVRA
ncbi:MAG TPA: beta-ketoacyl-[acyl-carrier-protein] synthase family protein [Aquabacterium sp.]|nr:beta-ketoacyl-[acyl-carrier-protein] synthase family protein [Aquabacterium sp.]